MSTATLNRQLELLENHFNKQRVANPGRVGSHFIDKARTARFARLEIKRLRRDVGVLLSNLNAVMKSDDDTLDHEDMAIIKQIRADLEASI